MNRKSLPQIKTDHIEPHLSQSDSENKERKRTSSETPDYQENRNPTPAGARNTTHGTTFQRNLLMQTLFQAMANGSKFDLWSEVEGAGKFDDLILGIQVEREYTLHFLQAKHAEKASNLGVRDLFRMAPLPSNYVLKLNDPNSKKTYEKCFKSNYSIYMYFNSWCSVYENKKWFHPQEDGFKIKSHYYLCTNNGINEAVGNAMVEIHHKDDLLSIVSTTKCYKFKCFDKEQTDILRNIASFNKIAEKEIIDKIEEFRDVFILAVEQLDNQELDATINTALDAMVTEKTLKTMFKQKIYSWLETKHCTKLDHETAEDMLASVMTTFCIDTCITNCKPPFEVQFTEKALENWCLTKFFEDKDKYILNIYSKGETLLTILRTLATLRKRKDEKTSGYMDNFEFLKMDWFLSNIPKYVRHIFTNKCKLIVVECGKSKQDNFRAIEKNLDELLKSEGSKKLVVISEESLNDNAEADDFNFTHFDLETQRNLLRIQVSFQGYDKPLNALLDLNKVELLKHIDGQFATKIIKQEKIVIFAPHNFFDRNKYVERHFIHVTKCSEEEILQKKNDFIISSPPGMGKTTVLRSISTKLINIEPDALTFVFDLKDCSQKFNRENSKFDGRQALDFIMELTKSDSIERSMFFIKIEEGRVNIFLDGFDEVCPFYSDHVKHLVDSLKKNGVRIFLTTRPNTSSQLQNAVHFPLIELEHISRKQQVTLLQKFWSSKEIVPPSENNIEDLLNKFNQDVSLPDLEFTGVALHTEMFGEVCIDEENNIKLYNRIANLADLYHIFINKKISIHYKEKENTPPNILESKGGERFEYTKKYHRLLACKLLNENLLQNDEKEKAEKYCDYVIKGKRNDGLIISVTDGRPHFVHRSFAEFFYAEFLLEKIINLTNESDKYKYVVSMFEPDAKYTRIFINLLLKKHLEDVEKIPFYKSLCSVQFIKETDFFLRKNFCMSLERLYDDNAVNIFECVLKSLLTAPDHFNHNSEQTGSNPQIEIINKILFHVARFADGDIMHKILEFRPNLDFVNAGRNVFHFSALNIKCNHILRLYEYGHKSRMDDGMILRLMNASDGNGMTPLALAFQNSNIPIIKTLLEKGVNLRGLTNEGHNIYHLIALMINKRSVIEEIIELLNSLELPEEEIRSLLEEKIDGSDVIDLIRSYISDSSSESFIFKMMKIFYSSH